MLLLPLLYVLAAIISARKTKCFSHCICWLLSFKEERQKALVIWSVGCCHLRKKLLLSLLGVLAAVIRRR